MRWTEERMDRLYARADAILNRRANGNALPVLEALSRRGHFPARITLANILTDPLPSPRNKQANELLRGLNLMRTDIRRRDGTTLHNLAIHYRNRGDMWRYRYWLARAARHNRDPYEIRELKAFETRFPHEIMRSHKRLRPYLKRDDWQCA